MPRQKKMATIEETIQLSSKVKIIVVAASDVYDTLDIQRVGGVVTVALPGAQRHVRVGAFVSDLGGTAEDTPVDPEAIEAARAALAARHPKGPLTADQLAANSGFDTGAIQRSIAAVMQTPFVGTSNEDGADA
jgi:hypothetical protein